MAKQLNAQQQALAQRVLADPEFQRLWALRNEATKGLPPSPFSPEYRAAATPIGQQIAARFKELGGNNDDFYFGIGPDGQPIPVDNGPGNLGALGKALMYTGIAGGAAIAAPAIAGAIGGGAGGGAGAAAGSVAGDVAGVEAAALGGGVTNPGFWGGLVSGAKSLGSKYLKDPEALGGVLSGVGDAMSANREGQMGRDLSRDAIRLREAEGFEANQQNRAKLLLEQQASERAAQSDAFRKALIGKLTANAQDATFDRSQFNNVSDIRLNGGLRLADLNREAGSALESQAMKALLTPEKRPEMAPIERTTPTPEKGGSFWENLISAGGLGLTALGKKKTVLADGEGDQQIH